VSAGEAAFPRAAALRRPTRLSPTRGWPRPTRKAVPFSGLLLFTFILFVAPQNVFPVLEPLKLAKLSVVLALAGYLVNRAMTGRPLTVMTPTVKWALVLTLIAILSIPAGFWPGGSVDVFLDVFGKSMMIFLLVANVTDTDKRFRALVGTMIGCGAYAAAHGVVNYATGRFDPTGQRIEGYQSPLAGNPNDLAMTLNIMLALAIGMLPVVRKRVPRALLIGAMALLVAGVVVSFSRSGFITLGVVGTMWAAQAFRERGGRALPAVALVVAVVLAAVPAGYSDRLSTITDSSADTTGSADERWETMMAATAHMVERPILGYGLGNHIHVSVARGSMARDAHNAYLKVGAEMGVGALVVYVLFIVSAVATARAVRKFFANRQNGWELGRLAGGVEMALIAYAVGAMFSPSPYHFYLFYPAGLAVALFAIGARVPAQAPGRGH
jgi:O-antigen ligase